VAFARSFHFNVGDLASAEAVLAEPYGLYAPGGSSHPHQHGCPVVGYVLEGSLRWQLQGGPERVYVAGTAFYEDPTDVHIVSANASNDRSVRFLAFFVCDDNRPLFVPARAPEQP
jgi:quercetin dioxygenase-like cupin family protein